MLTGSDGDISARVAGYTNERSIQIAGKALEYGSYLFGGGSVVAFTRGSKYASSLANSSTIIGAASGFVNSGDYTLHKFFASIGASALMSCGSGLLDRANNTLLSGSSFFVTNAMDD